MKKPALLKTVKTAKAPKTVKAAKHPALLQDLPNRLTELEKELRKYPTATASERLLKSIKDPAVGQIGKESVVQFVLNKNVYAAGHTDVSYAASNHARGVRHVRFYADGSLVLDIEGDFHNEQFGSNFRFQNTDVYLPGAWEADLVSITNEFRQHKADRKSAMSQSRAEEYHKIHSRRAPLLRKSDD